MTDPRTDPRQVALDEQWCAHQDARALGEDGPPPVSSDGAALSEAWAGELAFYEALSMEAGGQSHQPLSSEDVALVDQVLARDATGSPWEHSVESPPRPAAVLVANAGAAVEAADEGEAEDELAHQSSGRGRGLRWGVALVAVAAAVVLGLVVLTPDLGLRASAGAWVAQADRQRVERGDALPQAVWLVAEDQACAAIEGASVCAAEGSVVRIHRTRGRGMRLELRRGSVTVRGAVDIQTAEGTVEGAADSHYEVRIDGDVIDVEVFGGSLQLLGTDTIQSLGEGESRRLAEPSAVPTVIESEAQAESEVQAESESEAEPEPTTTLEVEAEVEPKTEPEASVRPQRPATKVARPAAPDELLSQARALSGRGDKRGAARTYRALIDAYPRSSEAQAARVSLGQLRLKTGRPKAALALFRRYLQGPGSLAEEARWGEIQALAALGRKSALAQAVEQFVRRYPRSVYRTRAEELVR